MASEKFFPRKLRSVYIKNTETFLSYLDVTNFNLIHNKDRKVASDIISFYGTKKAQCYD